ncbi:MAG: PspC domain-containing protein [Sphingobacteriaceae bacterium]|nr:PspC domain-containing protein [Sphingobacteriaceae bacterium]
MERRIYRLRTDRVLAGVASGIARHFKTDPVLIRVLFVAMALVGGGGILAYIILWAIIPEEPFGSFESTATTNSDTSADNSFTFAESNVPQARTGSLIAGIVLIVMGTLFLADEFLPDFNFGKYWPVLLVAIGIALLFTARKKEKS